MSRREIAAQYLPLSVYMRAHAGIPHKNKIHDRPEVLNSRVPESLGPREPLPHYRSIGKGEGSIDGGYHWPA